jgi:hypothetical protein
MSHLLEDLNSCPGSLLFQSFIVRFFRKFDKVEEYTIEDAIAIEMSFSMSFPLVDIVFDQ